MTSRLDIAAAKGCDGVDPDNVDGYDNDNGLGLTTDDSISYLRFLASEAFARNMSIGLKNAGATIADVIDVMQWSVNEQCVEYDECETYAPFVRLGKPVFHVEYPKGKRSNGKNVSRKVWSKYCRNEGEKEFDTILKNLDLDAWYESC